MTKEDVIQNAKALGFVLDYDEWDTPNKEWMRFKFEHIDLQEKDLVLIWWKDESLASNLHRAGQILFKSGRKSKVLELNNYL